MTAIVINLVTAVLLIISLKQDRKRTKQAVMVAGKKGLNLLPAFLAMAALIGMGRAVLLPEVIELYLGEEMNIRQVGVVSLLGSLATLPNLIIFPLAGSLLDSGASYTSIAALITTLTMDGRFCYFTARNKGIRKKICFI